MKIAIGSDHAGFELKETLKKYLTKKGWEVKDFGCYSPESMDYPDTAHPLCESIENHEFELGILMCGSGNGITMTANKHQQVRAALCWTPEIASLARQHNKANVLSMPARFITEETAKEIVDAYLSAKFEGGRHQRRIDKIPWCKNC